MKSPHDSKDISTVVSSFSPRARVFHAAKRCTELPDQPTIDPNKPRVKLLTHASHPCTVLGQKNGSKPIRAIIRQLDTLFFGFEPGDCDDGAEYFLLHDSRGFTDVGQDYWLYPVAVAGPEWRHRARDESGILLFRQCKIRYYLAIML